MPKYCQLYFFCYSQFGASGARVIDDFVFTGGQTFLDDFEWAQYIAIKIFLNLAFQVARTEKVFHYSIFQ